MPIRISKERKNDLVHRFKIQGQSVLRVYNDLPNNSKISIGYLSKLRNSIQYNTDDDNDIWVATNNNSTGRKRILSSQGRLFIKDLIDENNAITQRRITKRMPEFGVEVSNSTTCREVHRMNYSRKVLERRHILIDHGKRIEYYNQIKHYNFLKLVDIDEMSSSPKEFFLKYGYSPVGEAAIKYQIVLNGKTYSVICAYTPFGFLAWEIFENESVTAQGFIDFLQHRLRVHLPEGSFALVDNWSGHKTAESLAALEDVFQGLYIFSVPYCPFDKPVEKGIALVKSYIRDNEDEATTDPIRFINKAFSLFEVGGERADVCLAHWNGYKRNRENYINEFH